MSLVVLLLAVGAAACEPVDPPPPLVVTTTAQGRDADPGDGVCEVTPGGGDCTLEAAVDEGNALGRAAIRVPAGTYEGTRLTITGDLSVNRGAPTDVRLGSILVTVADGGRLHLEGAAAFRVPGPRFEVAGTFTAHRLDIVNLEGTRATVYVGPTGTAVIDSSLLAQYFGPVLPVVNDGTVALRHVTLFSEPGPGLRTGAGARTVAMSSVLMGCVGSPPDSLGYNSATDTSCALDGVGDLEGFTPTFHLHLAEPVTYDVPPDSPLVDAVPVGANGCGGDVDLLGDVRAVDGDGDGSAACDIGAREHPAP